MFTKLISTFVKLKLKGIKKFLKIFIITLVAIVVLLASPVILLQFNGIQNYAVDMLTTQLSLKFNTKIEIGKINYKFFNTLQLQNFYVEDQKADTLFYIQKLNAGFDFWNFFNKKVIFTDIEAESMYGNIKKDSTGGFNLDFLFIENNKKKKDTLMIDLSLDKLRISDSRIDFTDARADLTKKTFNAGKISFRDLNTEVYIRVLNKDSLNAGMKYFYARESSGLKIENIQFKVHGSSAGLTFPEFNIELPESKVSLNKLSLKIKSFADLENFTQKVVFHFPVRKARINLNDFRAFIPEFAGLHEQIDVDGLITGRLSSLKLQNLIVRYGKTFEMDANLDVNGLPNLNESFFYGQIKKLQISKAELQDLISKISKKPFVLQDDFDKLGMISYKGNITGFLGDLVAYGNLSTEIGSISSDISLRFENNLQDIVYNGRLSTNNLLLGTLFDNNRIGKVVIDLNTSGSKRYHQPFKGSITANLSELEFNSYNYTNAVFDGNYDGNGFNGNIEIKDDNIEARFNGIIDFRDPKVPVFDFNLIVNNTNLYALNLIKDYPGSLLSFEGKTNMSGSTFDNLNGYLYFKNIVFQNQGKTLNGNEFHFTSRTEPDKTNFIVKSDFVNGSFTGDFRYSSIGKTFKRILSQYLPSLSDKETNNNYKPNNVNIDLSIENTAEISRVLQIPYELEGVTTISGNINEATNKIDFVSRVGTVKTKNQIFENLNLRLESNQRQIQLTGRTKMQGKNTELLNVFLSADASEDDLSAKLIWQNNSEITDAGEIDTKTTFSKINNALTAQTHFNPTQIIISDSIWDIRSSDIFFGADGIVTVDNFLFENKEQFFHIDGVASKNHGDSLVVSMNELNLDYVMQLIRLKGISFGGVSTGKLKLFGVMKEPIFLADLVVKNFSMNNDVIGDTKILTTWDKKNSKLIIGGSITGKEKDTVAIARGEYVPANDSLDLRVDAKKLSAGFLNTYFEGVASNFSGFAKGEVRIFGPLKTVRIGADVFISEGKATIDMLKTTYTFNDRVVVSPKKIILNNITLLDEDKNRAIANGTINHNGLFSDMTYDVNINSDNILALNTRSVDQEFFYGKAYMGGLVHIFGNEEEANIIVNGISKPKTKCYMSMGTASSVIESDFIRFVKKNVINFTEDLQENVRKFVNDREFNVKVDMQIEMTPDAEMEILVDPVAGDRITGRGRGNLRIRFDTFSDVELYGTVDMDQGYYLFTLQTLIRKEFKINEGSTLTWSGDPYEAKVDINGFYPLTASLADIIERDELAQLTNRSTVPVQCLLHLTEDLMSPQIKFNIDLPASDESVKSRVKNLINTEEMMNRQILYLLLFHKFFSPDDIRANSNNFGINEGLSFLTSSFSSQFNNWIQSSFSSNIISFGFDWQKTDVVSDEIKAQVLIQPNNRLIINGNIGYRNDNISENKFIGDFDLEYKLMESGKLRFTAYNHTIDRAQLREAKTTQGIGLIYREEFNNFRELVDYYWGLTKGLFKKRKQ